MDLSEPSRIPPVHPSETAASTKKRRRPWERRHPCRRESHSATQTLVYPGMPASFGRTQPCSVHHLPPARQRSQNTPRPVESGIENPRSRTGRQCCRRSQESTSERSEPAKPNYASGSPPEDAGHGACWLRDPRIGEIVEDTLLRFDPERYRLIAWCIMPNHVHTLIEPAPNQSLEKVVHSWKSFTATAANKILHRKGAFWFREYHDRFIRDDAHLAKAVEYIEQNPVKAGLVAEASKWRFSSAFKKAA